MTDPIQRYECVVCNGPVEKCQEPPDDYCYGWHHLTNLPPGAAWHHARIKEATDG